MVTKEMLEARTDMPVISISARQEPGVELLEEQIKSMFFQENCPLTMKYISRMSAIRRRLRKHIRVLRWWQAALPWSMPEDFFSIDLMNAYEALGRIMGESVGEDLVNEIFSKFCTGKSGK